jgi:hypothetical protein
MFWKCDTFQNKKKTILLYIQWLHHLMLFSKKLVTSLLFPVMFVYLVNAIVTQELWSVELLLPSLVKSSVFLILWDGK